MNAEHLLIKSLNSDSGNDVTNSSSLDLGSADVTADAEPLSDTTKAIFGVLYVAVTMVTLGGNSMVCFLVATQRRMQNATNLFLVSLACSDALMASLCIPSTFIANVLTNQWPFNVALCPMVYYTQVSNLYTVLCSGKGNRVKVTEHTFLFKL